MTWLGSAAHLGNNVGENEKDAPLWSSSLNTAKRSQSIMLRVDFLSPPTGLACLLRRAHNPSRPVVIAIVKLELLFVGRARLDLDCKR